jgi:hypothetical protein
MAKAIENKKKEIVIYLISVLGEMFMLTAKKKPKSDCV